MDDENKKDQLEDLIKENLLLRTELNFYKSAKAGKGFFSSWAKRTSTNFLIGRGLKKSVKRLYEEIPEKNVSKDSLAEFTSHLIVRLTRIGTFAILISVVPLMILGVQTYILHTQNKLLHYQNNRLDQQINLEEGNRRSSLVFLMSNLMDKIGDEAKQPNNKGRLSESLISRIISLSQAFRPYRYLENDELIAEPLSPERGQLLLSLVNSNLNEAVYQKIFAKANFSFADLQGANFVNAYLKEVHLENANLSSANFQGAELDYAYLNGCNLRKANFDNALMNHINLVNSDLSGASLDNVEMQNGKMNDANLSSALFGGDFTNTSIRRSKVDSLTFKFVELEGLEIINGNIFEDLDKYHVSGKTYIDDYFDLEEKIIKDSSQKIIDQYFVFRRKKASTLGLMDDCQKRVLDMIKSTKRIRELESEAMKKKDPLIFVVKAHPFGEESLSIPKDTVYRYTLTTEQQAEGLPISELMFDPDDGFLIEMTLTDTVEHKVRSSKLKGLLLECWK